MDTQTTAVDRFMATLSEVTPLRQYLATLVVQAATAALARWFLGVAGWTALGLILHAPFTPGFVEALFAPFVDTFSPGFIAFLFAVGPLVWSAAAFWRPGTGRLWSERIGAFNPSEGESQLVDAAFEVLGRDATRPLRKLHIYVVDTNDKFAFVRGIALILSRGLVEEGPLAAVLSHELNHACTTDGRLMQALDRLVLWGDPLVRARDEETMKEFGVLAALFVGCLRWLFRLAGGSLPLRWMSPVWAPYWRRRELAADERAVSLGQGPTLAHHLKSWELPKERPRPRLLFNLQQYARVNYRRDVLESPPAHP
jgi:Zn-dependent protease with chaperone function